MPKTIQPMNNGGTSMSNLPITSNISQSPARDTPGAATRSDPAASGNAAPAAQDNGAAIDPAAENFPALLARQIGATDLPGLHGIPAAPNARSAAAGAGPTGKKDGKEQATLTASALSDPANAVAAMLLQIPAQHPAALPDPPADKGQNGRLPLTKGTGVIDRGTENSLQLAAGKSTGAVGAPSADSSHPTGDPSLVALPAGAVKHTGMVASSTGQIPIGQSMAKTTRSAVPAVMPNMLAGNTAADMPQPVATPLGNSGWAAEFSQKIVWMSTQQNHIAELHLNPPELGVLNVVMKFTDNQLTAQFTSPHSAVRDAVENALPKLREILADNNIMLGNATVSDQSPRDRSGDGFMNQGSNTTPQREPSYNPNEAGGLSPASVPGSPPARRHNGMLDTFA
jgi:flagellar hook-length control protein FliK